MPRYTDINAETIDEWVKNGWEWGRPISHEVYEKAASGIWDVLLTPTRAVPHSWFAPFLQNGRLDGVRLLGLASGGGQQMPVFAALGADCTVLDYSNAQLDSERKVAQREGYRIDIVRADMTLRLPFEDNSFDLIFHPVSNCYVEDVSHVWRECFRVLKPGGTLLAGLDNGINFLFDDMSARPLTVTGKLPYNPLRDEALMKKALANREGVQFSHTFDEQIGGQLKAGFVLSGAFEDYNSTADQAEHGIPAFWATRAVKPAEK